jgi:hypothetical protein
VCDSLQEIEQDGEVSAGNRDILDGSLGGWIRGQNIVHVADQRKGEWHEGAPSISWNTVAAAIADIGSAHVVVHCYQQGQDAREIPQVLDEKGVGVLYDIVGPLHRTVIVRGLKEEL